MAGIAFFDVDDTILKGSSGIFLAKMMVLDRGQMVTPAELFDYVKAFIQSRAGSIEYEDLVEKTLSRFEGNTRAQVEDVARECFDKYIRKHIYRGAYREVQWHKQQGNIVVLLTASITIIIEPLGEFLGAEKVFALNPIFEDNVMTTKAEKPYCYEEGKLILARQYAEERGVSLDDCYFYSDSISDLPLMEKVGHPNVTNPDPKLLRVALLKNFRIRWFSSVLPENFKPISNY